MAVQRYSVSMRNGTTRGATGQLLRGAVLTGSALALAATAAAQTASSPEELGEIVVTAQKRESTLQNTPISITAVSGGDMQDARHHRPHHRLRRRRPAFR
jgi:outer membrane receptor protein involved in Fe transport